MRRVYTIYTIYTYLHYLDFRQLYRIQVITYCNYTFTSWVFLYLCNHINKKII